MSEAAPSHLSDAQRADYMNENKAADAKASPSLSAGQAGEHAENQEIDAFAKDRFEAIELYAEKQISLWVSVREAAWRRERETLELHCRQIRILTLATFEAVRMIGQAKKQEAP